LITQKGKSIKKDADVVYKKSVEQIDQVIFICPLKGFNKMVLK